MCERGGFKGFKLLAFEIDAFVNEEKSSLIDGSFMRFHPLPTWTSCFSMWKVVKIWQHFEKLSFTIS